MDHHHSSDTKMDGQDAECGSTSWRVMTGKTRHSKTEAPPPPNASDYITPHPQSGPIITPVVPHPMKGRVTRSAGGTVSVSGVLSPTTAGKMRKVVPAPPFGFHADVVSDSGKLVRQEKITTMTASATKAGDDNQTDTSSATRSADGSAQALPPDPLMAVPGRSDSLEDELLEQAAANVAGICCDEIRDHATASAAASSSTQSSDPLGGHDSLELLMEKGIELGANGAGSNETTVDDK